MVFERGKALVGSVARVVQLTGAQDLRNLEASGELELTDLLLTASDAVYDRLVADGLDPRALANAEVYERAVAYQFLGILAAQAYFNGQEDAQSVADRHFGLSDRYYEQVRPRLATGDAPRTATEGLPAILNLPPSGLLGGPGGWRSRP